MTITTISAEQARRMQAQGATLVDIRAADEHARENISGARNLPLDRLEPGAIADGPVIFHCRSGMRTQANAAALAQAAGDCDCYILEGGIDGWRKAGLPVERDGSQPLELMRQVQLAAGGLILLGALLGYLVAPGFFALCAFVGAGLTFAGATGWCGMALLLQRMPWNRKLQTA